jgi:cyanophycinase
MSGMAEPKRIGTVVLIGGAEEKGPNADVLGRFVEALDGRKLVVMTCATEDPQGAWERYRKTFRELGVQDIAHVDVRDRVMALDDKTSAPLDGAGGVFFTGGDQLRITSHLGATPAFQRIKTIVDEGGVVAGTSAGAAVMSDTMLIGGASDNTPHVGDIVAMAPGFGFVNGYIVDIHFSERGRIGRLVGAVAQNPAILGVGVDEDTAVFVSDGCAEVVGSGGVWFIDGTTAHGSNISEGDPDETLAIQDVRVHVLNAGRRFDLVQKQVAG